MLYRFCTGLPQRAVEPPKLCAAVRCGELRASLLSAIMVVCGLSPGLAEPFRGDSVTRQAGKVMVPHLLQCPPVLEGNKTGGSVAGQRERDSGWASSWWLLLPIGGCVVHPGLGPALVQLAHSWMQSGRRGRVQTPKDCQGCASGASLDFPPNRKSLCTQLACSSPVVSATDKRVARCGQRRELPNAFCPQTAHM